MKHFIITIKYTASPDIISEILPEHRKFLQTGYDSGLLLFSGPMNPKTGGIVAARSESLEEIDFFFANDPYLLNKVADYSYIEFEPVKSQEFLKEWIA